MTHRATEIVYLYLKHKLSKAVSDEDKYKVWLDARECEQWDLADDIEKEIEGYVEQQLKNQP